MRTSLERRQPRTKPYRTITEVDNERTLQLVEERKEAVRRWIDSDDDSACRGID